MDAAPVWKLASSIDWRELDDEVVVYHAETGDTHHLGPIAGHVLRTLAPQSSGLPFQELVHRVGKVNPVADDRLEREVQYALDELARLSIAARMPA